MSVREGVLNYYNTNAVDFVKGTINADMGFNHKKSLGRIPEHGSIDRGRR